MTMLREIYSRLHRLTSKPEEREQYSGGFWQHVIRTQALGLCTPDKEKVLEVGCGEGLFLAQLGVQNPGTRLWGVDNSAERIRQAKQRLEPFHANLYVASGIDLPFQNDFFDAGICINVIFNLPSQEIVQKVLSEMRRVVRPGGIIIFDFRNAANPLLWLKYATAPLYDATVRNLPLKTYFLSDIRALCAQTRLAIRSKQHLGGMGISMAPLILIEAQKL